MPAQLLRVFRIIILYCFTPHILIYLSVCLNNIIIINITHLVILPDKVLEFVSYVNIKKILCNITCVHLFVCCFYCICYNCIFFIVFAMKIA